MWLNEHEIDEAERRWADHPVLGPASRTLSNLRHAVNANSDGWPYWSKPSRAAAKLMQLIHGDGTWESRYGEREDVTAADLRKALVPVKAFRTRYGDRYGIHFEIEEAP